MRNLILMVCLAITSLTAHAVKLSEDGQGEVLLFPYYKAGSLTSTRLFLSNHTDAPKALRLRALEGKNGRQVVDVNLYLPAQSAWEGEVARGHGGLELRGLTSACSVPLLAGQLGGRPEIFSAQAFNGPSEDGETTAPSRMEEGFIEVLEMGVPKQVKFGKVYLDDMINVPSRKSCQVIEEAWDPAGAFSVGTFGATNGVSPPSGGVSGGAQIVDNKGGLIAAYEAIALQEWNQSVPLHTAPGFPSPSLSDVTPKISKVTIQGREILSSWYLSRNPVDPVSAVLMTSSATFDFSPESIGAVVTFPTRRYYVEEQQGNEDDLSFGRPFSAGFSKGGACEDAGLTYLSENRSWSNLLDSETRLCWAVSFLESPVSAYEGGRSALAEKMPAVADQGAFRIGFSNELAQPRKQKDRDGLTVRELESDEGYSYRGLPLIGLVISKEGRTDRLDRADGLAIHTVRVR